MENLLKSNRGDFFFYKPLREENIYNKIDFGIWHPIVGAGRQQTITCTPANSSTGSFKLPSVLRTGAQQEKLCSSFRWLNSLFFSLCCTDPLKIPCLLQRRCWMEPFGKHQDTCLLSIVILHLKCHSKIVVRPLKLQAQSSIIAFCPDSNWLWTVKLVHYVWAYYSLPE